MPFHASNAENRILSHSSHENPDPGLGQYLRPGAERHALLPVPPDAYTWDYCKRDEATGTAVCQVNIDLERAWDAVESKLRKPHDNLGTTTYSVNETTLIQDACETATIYDAGSSVSPDDYALARRKLNMIAKQLSGSSDYSPGLKMWARKTGYLFLAKNTGSYSFGPSGDHCTESYAQTALYSNAAGGASTVVVSSATGIANTYYIGIELDSGLSNGRRSMEPIGNDVTLTAHTNERRVFREYGFLLPNQSKKSNRNPLCGAPLHLPG